MLFLFLIILLIVGVVYGSGTDNVDRHPVREFDLARYMGEWYEIARFDHPFERGLADVKASYRLCSDGRVEVLNTGYDLRMGCLRRAYGKAVACPIAGRLKVSFFWRFYSQYNVMALDDDYQWALVGGRTSKYLWILSRTPQLPALTLNRILHIARRRGYKTERLLFAVRTAQR